MCEQCHQLMQVVAHALEEHSATNRALLAYQRARIPKYLSQARQYVANAAALSLRLQSQELARVTCIIVVVGSAGTLTIGDRSIPVSANQTLYYLGEQGMLVRAEDPISLTQTTPGPMGLEMLGEEMADRGARW